MSARLDQTFGKYAQILQLLSSDIDTPGGNRGVAVEEIANFLASSYIDVYALVAVLRDELLLTVEGPPERALAKLRTDEWPRSPLAVALGWFVWNAPTRSNKQPRVGPGERFRIAPLQRFGCVVHTSTLFNGVYDSQCCGNEEPVYYPAEFLTSSTFLPSESLPATQNLRIMGCSALLHSAFSEDSSHARRIDLGGSRSFVLAARDVDTPQRNGDTQPTASFFYGTLTSGGRPGSTKVIGKLQSNDDVVIADGVVTARGFAIRFTAVGRARGGVWVLNCSGPWTTTPRG
jgi:hypothetical protein